MNLLIGHDSVQGPWAGKHLICEFFVTKQHLLIVFILDLTQYFQFSIVIVLKRNQSNLDLY